MVAVVVGEVSLPLPSSTKQVVERASDEGFRRGMVGLRRIPCKHRFLDACVEANVPTVCGYAIPHTALTPRMPSTTASHIDFEAICSQRYR